MNTTLKIVDRNKYDQSIKQYGSNNELSNESYNSDKIYEKNSNVFPKSYRSQTNM